MSAFRRRKLWNYKIYDCGMHAKCCSDKALLGPRNGVPWGYPKILPNVTRWALSQGRAFTHPSECFLLLCDAVWTMKPVGCRPTADGATEAVEPQERLVHTPLSRAHTTDTIGVVWKADCLLPCAGGVPCAVRALCEK